MNNDQEKLHSLLKRLADPAASPLTPEENRWLEDFRRRYPFFTIPAATRQGEPPLRDILTSPSPEAFARMQGNREASRFDDFYPEKKSTPTPSTSAAIDDFLNTYGHQSEEENELLERLIFNPVADYSQQLAREVEASLPSEEETASDPQSPESRLNRFILSHRAGSPTPLPDNTTQAPSKESPAIPEESKPSPTKNSAHPKKEKTEPKKTAAPDGLLSESLAKIYIKTRRYEQAYEILNGLSLRFPEKSRYFADQLRFLRKLILNERRHRIENESKNNPNP